MTIISVLASKSHPVLTVIQTGDMGFKMFASLEWLEILPLIEQADKVYIHNISDSSKVPF